MNITIYTKANCPNCVAAKQLLKSKGHIPSNLAFAAAIRARGNT